MKIPFLPLAVLAVSAVFTGSAFADTPGVSFTAPGTTTNNTDGFSIGYAFTTLFDTNVTALGYYDNGGLREAHQVGLFDGTGALLASTTITGNGTQVGFFNFNSITPILLAAGGEYEVEGTSGVIDNYTFNTVDFTVEPTIGFVLDTFALGNTLQFAISSTGITASAGGGIFGANFETDSTAVAVTPEPSSLMLFSTGFLGLAGVVRRRFLAWDGPR